MGGEVWVIDDDRSIRWVLEKALTQAGIDVVCFENADSVMEQMKTSVPALVVSDIRMPGKSGLELLEEINRQHPELPVIIMTAYSDLDSTVAAFQSGAFEYLPKPFDVDEAVELVTRSLESRVSSSDSAPESSAILEQEIIGAAPAMQEVFRAIGKLSRSHLTVLITGESGTGKELVARALHRHSPRANKAFIALNMPAIPKELLESELFGHERGAFTGALSQRRGRFEQADGGTLFLDEIGEMPAELQTRLLRVLADGEFFRVGGHTPIRADVRIIAATNQELEKRVDEGAFREDLFHRLNVIRVHVPPLRERQSDIEALIHNFLSRAAQELEIEPKTISGETMEYLKGLTWSGNVRELENTCRWLTVMAPGQEIVNQDLPVELQDRQTGPAGSGAWNVQLKEWAEAELNSGRAGLLDTALPLFERTLIEAALHKTGGRRQDAAKLLGWGRNTLTRKIKELDLNG